MALVFLSSGVFWLSLFPPLWANLPTQCHCQHGENTPLSGLNTLQWVFHQVPVWSPEWCEDPFLRPHPSWPVFGSCWLDPSQCWGWIRDRPTWRPAQDPLRDRNWHPASCRWKRKGVENVHRDTKFLFCLYSLTGTWEQQCLGQTRTGLQPNLCPRALGQGRKGPGTPAAAPAAGAVLRHVWSSNSFSGFTALKAKNESPLQRKEEATPLVTQLSSIYQQGKHFPPCLSTEREENP